MALNFPRWLALALIGFGIVFAVIFREPSANSDNRAAASVMRRRADRAGFQAGRAASRLHLLQVRDSVRSAMGSASTPRSRVAIDPAIEPQLRRLLGLLVESVNATRPVVPMVPVDVAFVLDTASLVRGIAYAHEGLLTPDYVLPRQKSGERCLVLVRVKRLGAFGERHPSVAARVLTDPARMRLLGPCAFFETFGEPSPTVDAWLRRRGWSYSLLAAWDAPIPMYRTRRRLMQDVQPGLSLFTDWTLRNATSSRSFACFAGDVGACERSILERPVIIPRGVPSARLWGEVVSTDANLADLREQWWYVPARELGPRDWTILAEMVRTLGPERFARFWHSGERPAEAFRAAAGTDIGSWTRDWAARMYGPQTRGPGVSGSSALLGLLIAALALGLAMALANRRAVA
jgi:hypothetical protein